MKNLNDVMNITEPPQFDNFCDEFGMDYINCPKCPFYNTCNTSDTFHYFIQDYGINRKTSAKEFIQKFLEWHAIPQSLINLVEVKD